jgi:hypothetical protein
MPFQHPVQTCQSVGEEEKVNNMKERKMRKTAREEPAANRTAKRCRWRRPGSSCTCQEL